MKLGIIIETKEYEKAWNAMRFAVASKKRGHEVNVFLMGEAVEIEDLSNEKYDVGEQVSRFHEIGGIILACGTFLKSRRWKALRPVRSQPWLIVWKCCIGRQDRYFKLLQNEKPSSTNADIAFLNSMTKIKLISKAYNEKMV